MNKETNIDETLAVLASDVKKLIKHFKLDRRKPDEGENQSDLQDSPDSVLLQNIAATVKEISERKLFTEEQMASMNRIINGVGKFFHKDQDAHHAELKSLLEVITGKLAEQQAAPQKTTPRHEHHFSVDFKNSKAAMTLQSNWNWRKCETCCLYG